MKADLVISNIGQLLTCASGGRLKRGERMRDVGITTDSAIAVIDGKIASMGNSAEIVRQYSSADQIDAGGKVVCPGFVDAHTHTVYAGDRLNEFELKIKGADYLDILAAGGGILSTVEKTRQASCNELVKLALARLDTMLACGTTTAEIKTGYGLDTDTELKMLSVIEELDKRHQIHIVPTFLSAHAVPTEYKENIDGYVGLVCDEMLPRAWDWYERSHFSAANVTFFVDVFCEKNAFDLKQSKMILETAQRIGFRLKAHVDEFSNLGGSRMAIGLGAISIDHLDTISSDEVKLLAASDTIGVVTPTVNFSFGSGTFADARTLINEGCAVALSTDFNPGSAPCPSLPMSMAIACRYQKLSPAEALNAATINSAFAIGVGDRTGSVETGKQADLLVLDTNDFRQVCYEFGSNLVTTVVRSGEIVMPRSL